MINTDEKKFWLVIMIVILGLYGFFMLAHPVMMDDGFQYEGFTESLAHGHLDFKLFYGFQGLSILSVPVFWLTGSKISIIITSLILFLLSIPLAYLTGREIYQDKKSGLIFVALILLTFYPYATMMRGFQESALLFFILLIIYASARQKKWSPLAWSYGALVKPFALTLFPLWLKKDSFSRKNVIWLVLALVLGGVYLGASYLQTGHLVNNAAINSYQGNFDIGNPPPLTESFKPNIISFGRVAANLFIHTRKILISPLIVLLGFWALFWNKTFKWRKPIIVSIILNILLVGSLSFSFSKYLLPTTVLLALASVPLVKKWGWPVQVLVLIDSFFVAKPIFDYFGKSFWPNLGIFLIPLYLSLAIFIILKFKNLELNS